VLSGVLTKVLGLPVVAFEGTRVISLELSAGHRPAIYSRPVDEQISSAIPANAATLSVE
jgi:hypothetical protein